MWVFDPTDENADGARRAAEKALALTPDLPEAHLATGLYQTLVRNDYSAAIKAFEAGLARSPAHPELLGSIGLAEQGLGNYERAIDYMRRGLALDPRSLLYVRRLTRALTWAHRFPEAEQQAQLALALAPSDASAIQYAALLRLSQGDLTGARTLFHSIPQGVDSLTVIAYWEENPIIASWAIPEDQRRLALGMPVEPFHDRLTRWSSLSNVALGMGDTGRARLYADSAGAELARRGRPLIPWLLAILRPKSEAFRQALREQESRLAKMEGDQFAGPGERHNLILTCLVAGEYERALTHLEALMKIPYYVTPAWLRIDPEFDPIRSSPRFQALLAAK
jgi:Flp pilus assembly protein TadD